MNPRVFPARRRARRANAAGFTLVELTVALVAGLIVALGIVGLSREATRTFNEESRSSAAEAAMRTAVDRLRADLARAGYMSTGNILSDTQIAHAPGLTNLQNVNNSRMTGLLNLAALTLLEGGSEVPNKLTLSAQQSPALHPDALLIAGNMTSAELFTVQQFVPPTGTCQQLLLSNVTPAVYRVATAGLTDATASAAFNNIFAPVAGNGQTAQFLVRLVDDTGHTQYLATCSRSDVAGVTAGVPYVWIDTTSTSILSAAQTAGVGGISGIAAGKAWINPVQIVRWEVMASSQEAINTQQFSTALGNTLSTGNLDPNKYDLIRSYVDAFGNTINASTEVVAEYAVDLDFAFTVDNTVTGSTAPSIVTFPFEDDHDNDLWGNTVGTQVGNSPPVNVGPQRIRSVRARLVVRAAQPDRTVNVPVTQINNNEEYMYRYCLVAPCTTTDAKLRWARARTMTTEVALPNNSGAFY